MIKDWERETVWLSGIWFWEHSGKSVGRNNHIENNFYCSVDNWFAVVKYLITTKTLTIKNLGVDKNSKYFL